MEKKSLLARGACCARAETALDLCLGNDCEPKQHLVK